MRVRWLLIAGAGLCLVLMIGCLATSGRRGSPRLTAENAEQLFGEIRPGMSEEEVEKRLGPGRLGPGRIPPGSLPFAQEGRLPADDGQPYWKVWTVGGTDQMLAVGFVNQHAQVVKRGDAVKEVFAPRGAE